MLVVPSIAVVPGISGDHRRRQGVEQRRDPTVGRRSCVTEHHDGQEHGERRQEEELDQADHVSPHLRERTMSRGTRADHPREDLTSPFSPCRAYVAEAA